MPDRIRTKCRTATLVAAGTCLAVLVASCSAAPGQQAPSTAAATVSSSPAPSVSTYASTSFVVPFDVAPPNWLDPKPTIEQSNFVTWEALHQPAVRFLAPQTVYRPGERNDTAVPKDYVSYLLGQTSVGAHFSDQTTVTIGGQTATVVTATTDESLDGSLGCPSKGMLAAACFGLQPEYSLRIAAAQVNGKTLLIWLRSDTIMSSADAASTIASFDAMLATLRFSTRPVQSASPPSETAIDGSYAMTISWPKTKAADARCVGGAEGTAAKVVYQLTLDHGSMELWVRVGGASAKRELGMTESYTVKGNQLTMGGLTADFTLNGTTLTLSNIQGGECGDRAIWTTKPWIRQ